MDRVHSGLSSSAAFVSAPQEFSAVEPIIKQNARLAAVFRFLGRDSRAKRSANPSGHGKIIGFKDRHSAGFFFLNS